MNARFRRAGWHGLRRAVRPLALASLFTALFFLLAHEAMVGPHYQALERHWIEVLGGLRTETLVSALLWVTGVYDGTIAILIAMIIAVQVHRRAWRRLRMSLALGLGVMALNWLAKQAFQRPRPQIVDALVSAHGYAFPSGHTIAAAGTAAMLVYWVWHETASRGWRAASLALGSGMVLVIGFSRVYLGVHYPSDVVGSLLEAAAWCGICIAVDRVIPEGTTHQGRRARKEPRSDLLQVSRGSRS